jgi:epoxyqueuosine reductase
VLDARRCIAYLTIELRGPIPEEFRPAVGQMVFGCDICQDVCPWNRKAPLTSLAEFQPRKIPPPANCEEGSSRMPGTIEARSLFAPELEWLASLDESEYRHAFRRSPVKRAKWRGLVRNVCVALGNSAAGLSAGARQRVKYLLERLANFPDPLIAEHARWALRRIATSENGLLREGDQCAAPGDRGGD